MNEYIGLIDPELALELVETHAPALFAQRLLSLAEGSAGIVELFAYVAGQDAPRILVSQSRLEDAAERAKAYRERFHRSDPLEAIHLNAPSGTGFMRRVPTSAIERGEYRKLCFEIPRFVEKISFCWRGAQQSIVLSFYRRDQGAEPDMRALSALAQIAITGLTRMTRPYPALLARIESRLGEAYPQLTPRERDVCARTLSGETAPEIAAALGLGTASVLTYRKRAYAKTGSSKANDLLNAILQ